MSNSLTGDEIQLWVADPAISGNFSAIPGELRSRLEINRAIQRSPAISSNGWHHQQPASSSCAIAIDVQGRSSHADGESWLQQSSLSGLPHRLRLRVAGVNWLEGEFIITRYSIDAPLGEESQFQFSAISHGQPIITPVIS